MITPAQENERRIARELGITEEDAASVLAQRIAITAGEGEASLFAAELKAQLERTIHVVSGPGDCDLEIVIHASKARSAAKNLSVLIEGDVVTVSSESLGSRTVPAASLHGVQRVLAACYTASVALARLIDGLRPDDGVDPFVINFAHLGATTTALATPIHCTEVALAGSGAIGNGFLHAAKHLNTRGQLTILDPKLVGGGNPNRCLFFDNNDVNLSKAERLAHNAQPYFQHLELIPHQATLSEYVKQHGPVRRVIVGTDSRAARRTVQNELPLEILDASTTGIDEVIAYSHRQPTEDACLACIYRHVPDESVRQKAIAEGLGIDLDDIVPGGLIDARVAALIAARHPDLYADALLGVAFDSLYKQLCAEQTLLVASGEQVLAPFAFVSNLAGALLALELVRFESGQRFEDNKNYLFASPWLPPHGRMRLRRPRVEGCSFCSKPTALRALQAVWPEIS